MPWGFKEQKVVGVRPLSNKSISFFGGLFRLYQKYLLFYFVFFIDKYFWFYDS